MERYVKVIFNEFADPVDEGSWTSLMILVTLDVDGIQNSVVGFTLVLQFGGYRA